jgi:prevent-host-death family protein
MKTVSEDEAKAELIKMLDASQEEKVVSTRNERPRAVLVGLADYDAERTLGSPSQRTFGG